MRQNHLFVLREQAERIARAQHPQRNPGAPGQFVHWQGQLVDRVSFGERNFNFTVA